MFSARRAAQMAGVFARKEGGEINILKLVKLVYLSDRESLQQHGMPISFDDLYSLPEGPVPSKTLNLVNGKYHARDTREWRAMIGQRSDHNVCLKVNFDRQDLDQLSDADLEILDEVWVRFGHMNGFELSDYTHRNCPEWEDPHGSRKPILDITILKAVGKTEDQAAVLAEDIEAERELDAMFARL